MYDLATEERLGQYALDAPARLAGGPRSPFVAATQAGADTVAIIDGGSWTDGHSHDGSAFHVHHYIRDARLLAAGIDVAAPGAAAVTAGTIAVFSDSLGAVHLVDQNSLYDGEVEAQVVDAGPPHDGVGLPLGDGVVVSDPSAGGLVHIRDRRRSALPACPGRAGHWSTGSWAAVGCDTGILAVTRDGAAVIPYLPGLPGGRAGQLTGSTGNTTLSWAGNQLLLVDVPGRAARTVALPAEVRGAGLDPEGQVVAVTADGAVHQVDAGSAETVAATEPGAVPVASGPSVPPVPVVVGGQRAYVAVTGDGQILEFATNDQLRLARTLQVDGAPGSLALLGTGL